jgi:hypothetical protein
VAGTSETWTNTYRGPDDAAMIGAFVRDAGAAAARGWHAVEQTWDEENGSRTLRVRYERDSGTTTAPIGPGASAAPTAEPITPAWRTPEPVTPRPIAPAWGRPAAVAPTPAAITPGHAAAAPRPVARSGIRSGIANIGALLFGVGAVVVLFVPSHGAIERAGFSAAALGLATWLVTRVWGGLALRRVGVRSVFGSPVGVIGAGIIAAWLAWSSVANFPALGRSPGTGITLGETSAPWTEASPGPEEPLLTETPIEATLTIGSPSDGAVINASSVVVSGIASPGEPVTCSRGPVHASDQTDWIGHWKLDIDLVDGMNVIFCQLDGYPAAHAVVTVSSDPTAGEEPSPPATGEPGATGEPDAWFTIGSDGGPDPFEFGPFELPPGTWTAAWTVTGSPGCAASFTMEANPEIGFGGVTFAGAAGPDGTAAGKGTFATSASGSHRLVAQVDCDAWTVSFGPGTP